MTDAILLFVRLRFSSKAVNGIAACMFGAYLIHDNPLVRTWLWRHLIDANAHLPNPRFILWAICMVLMVFVACTAMEFVRLRLFDASIHKIIARLRPLDERLSTFFREPM